MNRTGEGPTQVVSRRFRPSLYVQVLVAIALGALLGWLAPAWGIQMRPLGDGFIKIIKMLIAPLVFTTVAVGIAGMGSVRKLGRVGAKAILYFEVMTTLALVLGLAIVHVLKPGVGLHASVAALDTTDLDKTLAKPRPHGLVEHLLALIPDSFVGAFVSGEVLQVLLLAVLTGVVLSSLGSKAKRFLGLLDEGTTVLFAVIGLVMYLAPVGAFGAMAFTVGKYGVGTLGSLLKLMATFYVTAFAFVFIVLGSVLRALGFSMSSLLRYFREELVIVLGTSSSETVLPRLMSKLEHLGCSPSIVRLVVPTGYSFNLDGTSIYLTMAAVFVAQALDVPLTLGSEVSLLLVLLLTSKGAAAVTGGGFVTLAATLSSTGTIPASGLTLLLGIDRFMSEARALTNMVGNAVAAIVVSRWENELDVGRARSILRNDAAIVPNTEPSQEGNPAG